METLALATELTDRHLYLRKIDQSYGWTWQKIRVMSEAPTKSLIYMPNLHRYLLTIEFCTVPVFTARTMQYY